MLPTLSCCPSKGKWNKLAILGKKVSKQVLLMSMLMSISYIHQTPFWHSTRETESASSTVLHQTSPSFSACYFLCTGLMMTFCEARSKTVISSSSSSSPSNGLISRLSSGNVVIKPYFLLLLRLRSPIQRMKR